MSGKKSIIRTMFRTMLIAVFFLAIGGVILFMAKIESESSSTVPPGFVKIAGEIESIEVRTQERLVNNRKTTSTIYSASVRVAYEEKEYVGIIGVSPFAKEGSQIDVILNPSTGEVKPSSGEIGAFLDIINLIPGVLLTFVGLLIVLGAIISAIAKLSMFRERNKVCGVIVDAIENTHIIIDHKHPKKAICEFRNPFTGETRRIESANSTLDVFGMIGMNVPVYVNRRNPAKSFVDLESAAGNNQMQTGQPRVHDFRNL